MYSLAAYFQLFVAQCATHDIEKRKISSIPHEKAMDKLMNLIMCSRILVALVMEKTSRWKPNLEKVYYTTSKLKKVLYFFMLRIVCIKRITASIMSITLRIFFSSNKCS